MPTHSIVIPAFNEAARIGTTLAAYATAFDDAEIIVVLDGCSDATTAHVNLAASRWSNIRSVALPQHAGKGAAVVAGMRHAAAAVVGFVDADGSTDASEMRRLCAQLDGYDAVIGSRWIQGARVSAPQPWIRRRASRAFNAIVRTLFGLRFVDTQCGAKAFRAEAALPLLRFVETSNFAFDVDLLYLLARAGRRVKEVPIAWHDQSGSRVAMARAAFTMLIAVLRLRLLHSPLRPVLRSFDRLFGTNSMPPGDVGPTLARPPIET